MDQHAGAEERRWVILREGGRSTREAGHRRCLGRDLSGTEQSLPGKQRVDTTRLRRRGFGRSGTGRNGSPMIPGRRTGSRWMRPAERRAAFGRDSLGHGEPCGSGGPWERQRTRARSPRFHAPREIARLTGRLTGMSSPLSILLSLLPSCGWDPRGRQCRARQAAELGSQTIGTG